MFVHSAVCFLFLTKVSGPRLIPCWIVRVVTSNQPCTTLHPISKGVVIYSSTLQRIGWIWMDVCLYSFCLCVCGSTRLSGIWSSVLGSSWGGRPLVGSAACCLWSPGSSILGFGSLVQGLPLPWLGGCMVVIVTHRHTHARTNTHAHTRTQRHTPKLLNLFVYLRLFCLLYLLIRRLLVRSSLEAK